MIERQQLHERVILLGALSHASVRATLTQGHLFLNCSLTESFCVAILEAVCCGLAVCATRVGGVPEVLPDHQWVRYAEPNVGALVEVLSEMIPMVKHVKPRELHESVKHMYNWHRVSARTERVYESVLQSENIPLAERLLEYFDNFFNSF